MKIVSRPDEQTFGAGAFAMRMSFEELEFIAGILHVTRLGTAQYQNAAYTLMTTIEDLFGSDFTTDSAAKINLHVSHVGDDGFTILNQFSGADVILEV